MASKAKHAKRSKYSSHNYKPFLMFLRNAADKLYARIGQKYPIEGVK